MIVIGDGFASDHGKDKALLKQLALEASSASIVVTALVHEVWITKEHPKTITSLVRDPTIVEGVSDAIAAVRTAIDGTFDSYSVTFDATSFDWDGELHRVTLEAAEAVLLPMHVYLPEHGPRSKLSAWRWPLLALALGVLVALVLILRR